MIDKRTALKDIEELYDVNNMRMYYILKSYMQQMSEMTISYQRGSFQENILKDQTFLDFQQSIDDTHVWEAKTGSKKTKVSFFLVENDSYTIKGSNHSEFLIFVMMKCVFLTDLRSKTMTCYTFSVRPTIP